MPCLLPEDTMAMTMELEVEELCRMTVAKTPSMRPAMGFFRRSLSWNTLPTQTTHGLSHTGFFPQWSIYI